MPRTILLPGLALIMLAAPPRLPAQTGAPDLRLRSVTVIVRDYDEARKWYTEKLGFEVEIDRTFAPGQRFLRVHPPGQPGLGIVLETPGDGADPAMPRAYQDRIGKEVSWVFESEDVAKTYELLKGRGVEFTQAPKQRPWGTEALFRDLYGNAFVIIGPSRKSP
jgi:catechol 2,3-dioxygenase-like lactoylglutathione lyase family enzyme